MLIIFSKYNRKKHELSLKGYGKSITEMMMTMYAMAYKIKNDNCTDFKSVRQVFENCLELQETVEKVEEK